MGRGYRREGDGHMLMPSGIKSRGNRNLDFSQNAGCESKTCCVMRSCSELFSYFCCLLFSVLQTKKPETMKTVGLKNETERDPGTRAALP